MVVAGSGERVSSRFIMSHTFQLVRDLGILSGRAVVVQHEEHVVSQQPYVDIALFC